MLCFTFIVLQSQRFLKARNDFLDKLEIMFENIPKYFYYGSNSSSSSLVSKV